MKITLQEGLDNMRLRLERELNQCQDYLMSMLAYSYHCVDLIDASLNKGVDLDLQSISDDEANSDTCEKNVQQLIAKIILTQQPVAKDLRYISALMHLFADLERISDQCVDVAEILNDMGSDICLMTVKEMAHQVKKMVEHCVTCARVMDATLASKVVQEDDRLDECFNACKQNILDELKKDNKNSEDLLNQFMIAKYFERIGDHSVNVAEWVMYYCDGE